MRNNDLPKLITISGPTAAGKTGWSLDIANDIDSEIISADSRQVYKYMNIGTAKPEGEWKWFLDADEMPDSAYFINNTPHYLIDFLYLDQDFNLAKFQNLAKEYIDKIHKKDKTPMLVGGTGLYVKSVVDNYNLPGVPPNENLRKNLNEMPLDDLVEILQKVDPKAIKNIDKDNRVRVVRAIEVATSTGKSFIETKGKGEKLYDTLQIGVKVDRERLYKKINKRVEKMFDRGLVEEVEGLLERGYSWELSSMKGIGYREFRGYFESKVSLDKVKEEIKKDTRHYAKRQLSWFRRDDRINWCEDLQEAKRLINEFLEK